jgi:hypothetical protein
MDAIQQQCKLTMHSFYLDQRHNSSTKDRQLFVRTEKVGKGMITFKSFAWDASTLSSGFLRESCFQNNANYLNLNHRKLKLLTLLEILANLHCVLPIF